jgi:hypothetical protein
VSGWIAKQLAVVFTWLAKFLTKHVTPVENNFKIKLEVYLKILKIKLWLIRTFLFFLSGRGDFIWTFLF